MKKIRLITFLVATILVFSMFTLSAFAAELTGTALKIVDFSSDHPSDTGDDDYRASFANDGDPNTFWNNEWSPLAPPPHHITFDLGKSYSITGFKYLPRQDGYVGEDNGNLGPYEIYVSDDNVSFTKAAEGALNGDTMKESTVTLSTAATGRYFKLVKPTGDYIDMAEITISVADGAVSTASPPTDDLSMIPYGAIVLMSLAGILTTKKLRRR